MRKRKYRIRVEHTIQCDYYIPEVRSGLFFWNGLSYSGKELFTIPGERLRTQQGAINAIYGHVSDRRDKHASDAVRSSIIPVGWLP